MSQDKISNPFKSRAFSRRAVLHGAGCTMALPWLESVSAIAEPTAADFPKRFGVVFLGCGVNENHWSAEGNGADMKLGKTLSPLEPLKQKINVVDGLYVKALTNQGIHPAQTGSLLSGVPITKGAIIHSGISVDQMIANHVGQDTPQSSIVLACEQPMTGFHETNFSLAYSSHLSWQTPDSPVPVEVYPAAGLGQSVRQSRQPAQCQRAGPGQGPRPGPVAQDQQHRPRQAGRISDQRARSGKARRTDAQGRRRRQGRGQGQEHACWPPWTGPATACRKTCASMPS